MHILACYGAALFGSVYFLVFLVVSLSSLGFHGNAHGDMVCIDAYGMFVMGGISVYPEEEIKRRGGGISSRKPKPCNTVPVRGPGLRLIGQSTTYATHPCTVRAGNRSAPSAHTLFLL